MFALNKIPEYLVCKLSTHFDFSLGHKSDITILRLVRDLAYFRESSEVKFYRWLYNITSNLDFERKIFNSLEYDEDRIPSIFQIFKKRNFKAIMLKNRVCLL